MKRFGFLVFLLILTIIESAISIHLSLIASLVLLQFIEVSILVWWVFLAGIVLDLLLGNFLGVNAFILIGIVLIFDFFKKFLWPNLTYDVFQKQTLVITIVAVVLTSRIYEFLYNLVSFNTINFGFDLKIIPVEIATTLIFFPLISYLSLRFTPKKQLEIKF